MVKVILSLVFTSFFISSFTFAQTTSSSHENYELGKKLLNEGKIPEALQKFDQLIVSGFEDIEIFKYRGIARSRLDDCKGAADDLYKVIGSKDPTVDGFLGICKYEFGEKGAALHFLLQATNTGFSESKGHLYLGYLLYDDKQYEEAVTQLTKAEQGGHTETQLYKYRGIAAYFAGEQDLAIKDLLKIVKLPKPSLDVYEAIGLAYTAKEDFKKGKTYLQKADSAGSENSKVFFNLARSWEEDNKFDRAIENYDRAIALNYSGAEVYTRRGTCKLMAGSINASISDFDFAIKLDVKNSAAYRGRVAANLSLKNYARVVTDFAIIHALGSSEISDMGILSVAKYELKNFQGALDEANAALTKGITSYTINGQNYSYYLQKGKCLNALGRFDEAILTFNQVEESENSAALAIERAHAYMGIREYDKAIQHLEKAQLKFPKNATLFYNSAVVKDEMEDFAAAILDYNKAISLNTSDAAAYYARGNSNARTGKITEAIADLDKAIDLESNNPTFYKVRANFHYQMKNKDKACFDWRKAVEYGDSKARFSIDQYCNSK